MSGPMGLVYETPGSPSTADVWGTALNVALGLIEQHDHTSGKGSLVPSAGIGINADLAFAGFALTGAKAFTFAPVVPSTITSYAGALFISNADNELYYRTISGSNVKFTNGAALNVAAFTGGIGGDYSAAGALVAYDDATRTYWFQQEGSPRPWATVAAGDLQLFQKAASIVNKVTIKSPNALGASYTVTWPAAVPASNGFVQVDTAGTLTFAPTPTLSGTNYIKRGTRTFGGMPFVGAYSSNVSGGGVTTGSTRIGVACPASSSNTLLCQVCDSDFRLMTITSVIVYAGVSGGSVTFTLHLSSSAGNTAAVPGASASTSVLSQYSPITLTPTTPINMSTDMIPGGCFGLNVNCGAGVTCNVQSVEFVTTVT